MSRALLAWGALALSVAALALSVAVLARLDPTPRLVGLGCAGASGPLYAASESDFPPCREIRRRR